MLQTKDYVASGTSIGGLIPYQYILRVTENSVDVEANTSNVTVKAILYAEFYKLVFSGWYVGVSCTINGETIFSDMQLRRCEGNEESLYYTWTGDMEHLTDGSLELCVGGELWVTATKGYLPNRLTILENAEDPFVLSEIERNKPPSAPIFMPLPEIVPASIPLNIDWESSDDPDGDSVSYVLERQTGTGEFQQIYQGADPSFSDSISDFQGKKINYRLYAMDSEGKQSNYAECSTTVNAVPVLSQTALFGVFDAEGNLIEGYRSGCVVNAAWDGFYDPDGGMLQCKIYAKLDGGEWFEVATVETSDGSGNVEVFVEAESNQIIQFGITATDTYGDSCENLLLYQEMVCISGGGRIASEGKYSLHTPEICSVKHVPYVYCNEKWTRHTG